MGCCVLMCTDLVWYVRIDNYQTVIMENLVSVLFWLKAQNFCQTYFMFFAKQDKLHLAT